jgi:PPM family protein phosphatase
VNDLLLIGEFSRRSGLSVKRLRTYAAEGLLVPAAVDPDSSYRYYAAQQVPEARLIDVLRQAGMPLAGIQSFLRQPSSQRLDAWARRLELNEAQRQEALERARKLLADEGLLFPLTQGGDRSEVGMTLSSAGRTERGLVRKNNQDAVVVSELLALVADGMGGHPGGDVAAAIATDVVQAAFTGRSADELETAVRAANWVVWDRAAAVSELAGMGTTICAIGLLPEGSVALVNVGDSRAYLWRAGRLTQLTRDHSVTGELVERGELVDEEVPGHPHHGVLTRALGVAPDVEMDCTTLAPEPRDRFVVCTDGLYNELPASEISRVMDSGQTITAIADDLIERAVAAGGHDNVSVVIAELSP